MPSELKKCQNKDCFHNSGMSKTDVLLYPELLQNINFGSRGLSSKNPLLEFCLDDGFHPCSESSKTLFKTSSSLLIHCSSELDPQQLKTFVKSGSNVNIQNYRGQSALHLLINALNKETYPLIHSCVSTLLTFHINLNLTDSNGDTALHLLVQNCKADLIDEIIILINLFLQEGIELNLLNRSGRSALSYSTFPGITRVLLNYGAKVWPSKERHHSAFTWFIKAVIQHRTLTPYFEEILNLLIYAMISEENSELTLKQHVTSTMLSLGRHYDVIGPLFAEIIRRISPYWRQPFALKYGSLIKIRQLLKNQNQIVSSSSIHELMLPVKLENYLNLLHI